MLRLTLRSVTSIMCILHKSTGVPQSKKAVMWDSAWLP